MRGRPEISLRATLAQRNRLSLAKAHEELFGRPSAGALAERVCQVSVQALQGTFAALSAEGLERALFCNIVRRIEQRAAGTDYQIILANTQEDFSSESERVRALVKHKIDGLIIVPCRGDSPVPAT